MIEKFQGALVGYAVGDALAAPIEDLVREPSLGVELTVDYQKAAPSHPVSHLEPGQYSDETQIMLLMAETLLAKKAFHPEDFAHRLIDWYQTQKFRSSWRFPSNTMMKAARKLAAGTPWNLSGFPSAGVVAVVRTLPLALVYWKHPGLLKDAVDKSCRITHTDPRVVGCSIVLATVIRLGLEGAEANPETVITAVMEKAQVYAAELMRRLKLVKDLLRVELPAAVQQIGNGGFCLEAVPLALHCFLRFPRKFDEMIVAAANVGGDSDAIAAMAGAMFGAFHGIGAIPSRWLDRLEDSERLKQTGADLYRMTVPNR